jgi:hypothetical protein
MCIFFFFFWIMCFLSFFLIADHFPITYEDGLHESSYIYVHTTCVFGYFYKYHVIDSSQPSSLLCLKCWIQNRKINYIKKLYKSYFRIHLKF